jgi:uncharacterized membrane-anchored protein
MNANAESPMRHVASKVPEVTLGFWIVKVAATTLGETGGDWVTMSLKLGYAVGTGIFLALFIALVFVQVRGRAFHPVIYWATIVATTTLGTTVADFCDRSLGVGYPGGVGIVFSMLLVSLAVWRHVEGTVSFRSITSARAEWFYWITILCSQTLGTALGDFVATRDRGGMGLGFEYGALVFSGGLVVVAGCYFWTKLSRTLLFWAAFVLTRPLGATLGDLLDKPIAQGGLHLSRLYASLALLVFIGVCVMAIPQRAAKPGGVG